jgi:hypothetical protein
MFLVDLTKVDYNYKFNNWLLYILLNLYLYACHRTVFTYCQYLDLLMS